MDESPIIPITAGTATVHREAVFSRLFSMAGKIGGVYNGVLYNVVFFLLSFGPVGRGGKYTNLERLPVKIVFPKEEEEHFFQSAGGVINCGKQPGKILPKSFPHATFRPTACMPSSRMTAVFF